MTVLFSQILNMSLTGSAVILLVLAARLALKKAPKIYSYALWSVVLFRLLCPVALSVPDAPLEILQPEVIQSGTATSSISYIPAELIREEPTQTEDIPQVGNPEVGVQNAAETSVSRLTVVACIWLVGAAVMALKSAVQYAQLCRRMIGAMRCGRDIYIADHITSPFVMGILDPKIYLPSAIPEKERRYIIAHERHHIRRFDHIIKFLAYAALCLHWFNPLAWVAFVQAGKDMEMSCDEAVVRRYGANIRADYSASLLRLATGQRIISGMPIAFGEGDTKGRILNMAKWKKPKVWVSIVSLVLCIAILAACAVNPAQEQPELNFGNFGLILPKGLSLEPDEGGSYAITDGVQAVGGLAKRKLPDPGITTEDMDDWVKAVGVPEAQDDGMAYMIGNSLYATLEANFFPDVPDQEQAIAGEVTHYLYQDVDAVYDLWFWEARIEEEAKWFILERASLKGAGLTESQAMPVDLISEFHVELPDGYSLVNSGDGTRTMAHDLTMVGGIVKYAAPDMDYEDNMAEWVTELGVPEIQDGIMSYMMEDFGGSFAFSAYFFNEFVDEEERAATETIHYFFVDGDIVYDLWFYDGIIENAAKKEILNSAGFGAAPVEAAVSSNTFTAGMPVQGKDVTADISVEELSTEDCRAVLDMVQSGSCQIALEQVSGSTDLLWSVSNYYQHEGNWLKLVDVDPATEDIVDGEEYSVRMAFMDINGDRYSNEGLFGKAYSEIQWTEGGSFDDHVKPWLANFQWNENVVYMDTLTEENGRCVMLRVDEHFAGREDYAPHYFVNFYFDPEGNFRNVQLQVNLFQENEFTVTESIVSMDAETANREIQEAYQRAIG